MVQLKDACGNTVEATIDLENCDAIVESCVKQLQYDLAALEDAKLISPEALQMQFTV